jgi:hypothetical protein
MGNHAAFSVYPLALLGSGAKLAALMPQHPDLVAGYLRGDARILLLLSTSA